MPRLLQIEITPEVAAQLVAAFVAVVAALAAWIRGKFQVSAARRNLELGEIRLAQQQQRMTQLENSAKLHALVEAERARNQT